MDLGSPCMTSKASAAYRKSKRDSLLDFYREFYTSTSVKSVDTSQYSADEKSSLSIKGGHRYMPRPARVDLPEGYKRPVGNLTPAQLSEYNCESKRRLLSVYGDLFDVSDRPDKYGPEGPYSSMTGHDVTWALWSGYDDEENWDKYYDLHKAQPKDVRDRRLQGLMSWRAFFEKEYGSPVGRLVAYDNEWDLPPPPTVQDVCSVM